MLTELNYYKSIWHKTSEAVKKEYKINPKEIEPYLLSNKKFNEWFVRSFKPASPTFQELVIKQIRNDAKLSLNEILDREVDDSTRTIESSFSSDSAYESDDNQQIINLNPTGDSKKIRKRKKENQEK